MDINTNSACVVIPARYKSSRFPGKPLVILNGKPMILWVADRAALAVGIDDVYIATDDERIANVVSQAGYKFIMTESALLTGTDRVARASEKLNYHIIINLQGDEPMVDPEDIKNCIKTKLSNLDKVINGFTIISDEEKIESVNIPKVLFNEQGDLVYISRNVIPGFKDSSFRPDKYFKQVCIYAYTKEELSKFYSFGRKSVIENFEDIEILRFFEIGIKVRMVSCSNGSLAVDTPEDVILVENALREIDGNKFV